jgi:peptide/nickel transport system permease protein
MLGLLRASVHLFGVDAPGVISLFGTDSLGRDVLSRTLIATRISCSIGLISIMISVVLGLVIGAASGLFGGLWDTIIQKISVLITIQVLLYDGLAAPTQTVSRHSILR